MLLCYKETNFVTQEDGVAGREAYDSLHRLCHELVGYNLSPLPVILSQRQLPPRMQARLQRQDRPVPGVPNMDPQF